MSLKDLFHIFSTQYIPIDKKKKSTNKKRTVRCSSCGHIINFNKTTRRRMGRIVCPCGAKRFIKIGKNIKEEET